MTSRKLIAAAVLALIGTAASAAPTDVGNSRADVIAERNAFLHDSQARMLSNGEAYGTVPAPMARSIPRGELMASSASNGVESDVQAATSGDVSPASPAEQPAPAKVWHQAHGHHSLFRANDEGGAQPTDMAAVGESTTTRAEVRAELMSARANGELDERGETYGDLAYTRVGSLPQPAAQSVASIAIATPSQDTNETVVLWVPVDDSVSLKPGEALLIVPMDDDAE